ncbi:MAG TPA: triose-phosphate isomerase [Thermoanaerobaculia bacterium]
MSPARASRLFVANWKMHKTRAEARAFAEELGAAWTPVPERELVVAPSFTLLDAARDPKGRWGLGCQNVASEDSGAFTGEVSARMAADAGCTYAIVGHSERRRLFGEDGPVLAKKIARCREAGLVPIYCIGETAEERDAGLTDAILARQLAALDGDPPSSPLVVAYEPVWAIGTGRSASPKDCGAACVCITEILSARPGLRLLYGGSVTPGNAGELLAAPRTDGFLIGGASLSAASFAAIARA